MVKRTATVLSACLLALKGYECQTINTSSVAIAESTSQPATRNAITIPAIIKPVIQPYDTNTLAPSVPNYGGVFSSQAPPPIIITGSNGGSSDSFVNLLFLLFILNNKKCGNGIGCGCGGGGNCCRGGNNCYGGGYGGGYGGPYRPPIYTPPVVDYYDVYESTYASANSGASAGTYGGNGGSYANSNSVAEITVTEGYYVEEPAAIAPNPYPYQTIQPYPGREPNEICLIVRTDFPPSISV